MLEGNKGTAADEVTEIMDQLLLMLASSRSTTVT